MINTFDFEPIAKVSIKNLEHNAQFVKDILNGKKLISVVKSDAYGHGIEVCKYLDKYSNSFAVSKLDEVFGIRFLGIRKDILMLIPQSLENVRILSRYNTQIVCHSYDYALALSRLNSPEVIKVNLKVDSGMSRLGFNDLGDFENALKLLVKSRNIRLYGVYSHFSCPENEKITSLQYERFMTFARLAQKYFAPMLHISASGGLLNNKYNLDGARVGLLLYGYAPSGFSAPVKPVMKIVANSICSKHFEVGDKCLYNFEIQGSGTYKLVNYGYADGLYRAHNPNRCMDLSFEKSNSQEVIIMDNAQELAERLGASVYEIITNSTKRIKKVYYEDNRWQI